MTRRRDILKYAAAGGLGMAASPALARAIGAPAAQASAIGESFVFPQWLSAMDRAVAARGNPGDRAFWRAFLEGGAGLDGASDPGRVGLVALPAPGVELFAPDEARAMAALANDRLAAAVRQGDGRMVGLATVSAADPDAVREAERAIGRLGLSGLALGANRQGRLDDRGLWPLYAFAQSAGVAVYLPASYAPATGDIPYRALGAPGVLAGAAAESARHARQLIFGGVLDAFPRLNVVLARLGEGAPYWHSELVETHAVLADAGARLPDRSVDSYFGRNILMTTADIASSETLAFCADIIGPARVLRAQTQAIGSDMAAATISLRA